ncbi:MAG: phosphoenolpyruvate--protein phosphotransferase [Gemmatimonadota bacterium]|jgi:phosphotransferase system enzyme I (PtsI)|nr:phosphoenolpyruvate--protein phosphotransferase [Gemmatimonadota bacterium]
MSESTVLHGIGVSPGVAYAPALIVDLRFPDVADRTIAPDQIEEEVARLRNAVAAVVTQLDLLKQRVLDRAGPEESQIFEAQILMVQDPEFLGSVEHLIRHNNLSAETAYEFKALEVRVAWAGTSNVRLRERLADLSAIQIRMLHALLGHASEDLDKLQPDGPVIIVAHELSPGLTVQLDRERLAGLVSEEGTRTSHAAILAHSLGIPAVMGVSGALGRIAAGTIVLLDGQSGELVLDPSPEDLRQASTQVNRRRKLELELESMVGQPCVTPDGHAIQLLANVDLPEEIDQAVRSGAEGVGLVRTEFLVLGRTRLPAEEEQAGYFRRVAAAFPDGPVTIRTYDLGGDKFPAAFDAPTEANPFLGWRSIRVCLDHPHIFRPQLRALLRASLAGNIRIMLPLVTRVDEVTQTRELIEEEAEHLRRAGIPAAATVTLGAMIETPAAVILADRLAEVCDFFSIGTNDLTQYTLAVDRSNAHLSRRFTPQDPAVIRQIRDVLAAGRAAGIPVGVCGEMASEPLLAVLLLGLGCESLSVAPPTLLLLKWLIRRIPMEASRAAAREALGAATATEVGDALRRHVAPHIDLRLLDPHGPLPARAAHA